ncbi:ThuA domain-containing protein [Aquisediminimonas profunda]|uniref:ThuA domain-containing protein n=1 Tax=Aquisediminimonas profunda TaxID=1550733 RepID=UPI001C635A63|nr:ThuA domain-containing protein [Aquisediminimonas profunda]
MRIVRALSLAFAAVSSAWLVPAPAQAKAPPMLDCAGRDAPFSINSPFIDVLLNAEARRLAELATGQDFSKGDPVFVGTKPPSFASILTIKEAAAFAGVDLKILPDLDRKLRALPVSHADKIARCARYDNDRPRFALQKGKKPRLLLFEKINGFRDAPSVNAAHAAIIAMAERKGWTLAITDKGGAFNSATLGHFDAVIWNNISGDVLTLGQRRAFQDYLNGGGAFVGVHGSAGDPIYFWDWYPDTLIGARFAGHPMNPQFQEARITVNQSSVLAEGLPSEWRMTDEWYSFKSSPRATGAQVVLSLDESTYRRQGRFGEPLDMGADHPLAWTRCIGKGRMFYSAIGHLPETYSQPQHVRLLENAISWAATNSSQCRKP